MTDSKNGDGGGVEHEAVRSAEAQGYTLHRMPIPLDMIAVLKDDTEQQYRIPSWRVEFDKLPGDFDLRVHRGLEADGGWIITEATTGMRLYAGWGDHDSAEEICELFIALQIDKMTPQMLTAAIAKGHAKLAERHASTCS